MIKLSNENIQEIGKLRMEGMQGKEIAKIFNVTPACVTKAMYRCRSTDHFEPDPEKEPIKRPPSEYSNQKSFNYYIPVRERRL